MLELPTGTATDTLAGTASPSGNGSGQAQVAELIRRMQALHAGQVKLIDDAEARARIIIAFGVSGRKRTGQIERIRSAGRASI